MGNNLINGGGATGPTDGSVGPTDGSVDPTDGPTGPTGFINGPSTNYIICTIFLVAIAFSEILVYTISK